MVVLKGERDVRNAGRDVAVAQGQLQVLVFIGDRRVDLGFRDSEGTDGALGPQEVDRRDAVVALVLLRQGPRAPQGNLAAVLQRDAVVH